MLPDRTRRLLRIAATPSVIFAAIVLACGWMEVSPFASWPSGLVLLLCAPCVVPLLLLVTEIATRQGRTLEKRNPYRPPLLEPERFRWRTALTRPRAILLGVVAAFALVSFIKSIGDSRATSSVVSATRTKETRDVSGPLMLMGAVGLLAQVRPATTQPRSTRPPSGVHRPLNRPGGSRAAARNDDSPGSPS